MSAAIHWAEFGIRDAEVSYILMSDLRKGAGGNSDESGSLRFVLANRFGSLIKAEKEES
jgi:hypothetical protein